jgi:hypothetical protein
MDQSLLSQLWLIPHFATAAAVKRTVKLQAKQPGQYYHRCPFRPPKVLF